MGRSLITVLVHCFVFTDPAATLIYTLSLHDALPISLAVAAAAHTLAAHGLEARHLRPFRTAADREIGLVEQVLRSEEHTSELQSRRDLVCRLLLEKKNE